ncbi:MAG: hypothetical protein IJ736_10340 [Firmicutes bacterium]|nr:hypothetical protein [Bacillota bacterium]
MWIFRGSLKPIFEEDIRSTLKNLRYPLRNSLEEIKAAEMLLKNTAE